MKTVCKAKIFFSALLALLVFVSCSDDEDTPTMELSTSSVTFQATGGEESVAITTNQSEWNATRPMTDTWCILKVDGNNLRISTSANETVFSRSTKITVVAGNGTNAKTQEITVLQNAATPYIKIEGTTPVAINGAGEAVELTISTNNEDWNATRPDADDWCTLVKDGNKLTISATAYAVNDVRTTKVTLTSGTDATLVTEIFNVSQTGEVPCYNIAIPSARNFLESNIKQVVYNGVKVAEICKEYIRTGATDKSMVVVYPVKDGKTDLTKGYEPETGGKIVWNLETNTCEYTPGTESTTVTTVYLSDDEFATTTSVSSPVATTVEDEFLIDNRPGDKKNNYKIVKIGTQYWMAENLQAQRYVNGDEILYIAGINETGMTEWKNNKTGAHRYAEGDVAYLTTYGVIYNGYALDNEAGLTPVGWTVPSNEEWDKMLSYVDNKLANVGEKLKSLTFWNSGAAGTNITGFDARGVGEYIPTTEQGDVGGNTKACFWSSTKGQDFLVDRNKPAPYTYIFGTTNKVSSQIHSSTSGHYIRCIRK